MISKAKSNWSTTITNVLRQHLFKGITLVIFIMLVSIITSIIHADIVKRIVKVVINLNKASLIKVLIWLISITIISVLLRVVIARWKFFFKKKLRFVLEDKGITALYDQQGAPSLKYDEIMSLIQNSVEELVNGFLKTVNDTIITITQIIASVIYTITISWEMVLVCFLISGIMLLISRKNHKLIPVKMKKVGESFNRVHSIIWDHLHNAEVTSFLNKDRVFHHLDQNITETSDQLIDADKVKISSIVFSRFGSIIIVMVTALYGGFIAINYGMEVSNILALILILQILADSIFKIPNLVIQFKGMQGQGQVLDKLYTMVYSHQQREARVESTPPETIRMESISFAHSDDDSNLLDRKSVV